MKLLAILLPLLLIPVAQADDAEKTRAEIKRLEKRAEKQLNDGKRAQAFATLAQIAEMRAGLKKKPQPKRAVDAPKPARRMEATATARPRAVPAQVALDRALAAGNLNAARQANARLKVELRRRAETQKRINQRRSARLAQLEKQVQELKKLLQR